MVGGNEQNIDFYAKIFIKRYAWCSMKINNNIENDYEVQ